MSEPGADAAGRVHRCRFDLGGCRKPVTTAMRVGDAPEFTTLGCDEHTAKVIAHQAKAGVPVATRPVGEVEVQGKCAACWRSHGCDLGERHTGEHRCDCDDVPTADDEVFSFATMAACARLGGVRR